MNHKLLLSYLSGTAIILLVSTLADDSLTRQAVAEQYVCTAVRDNTIFEVGTGNSNGSGSWFGAGRSATESQRGLIQFDLSQIPNDSIVDSATLGLYVIDAPRQDYTTTRHFWLQALQGIGTPSWGEGSSSAGWYGEGQGVAAQSGDATWLFKRFDTDPWPAGNGALGPDPIIYPDTSLAAGSVPGVAIIPTPVDPLLVEWTKIASTDQMILDIQAWVDGTIPNDGWVVLGEEDPAVSRTKRRFASHEDPLYYPTLTVHTVPEPSAWLLSLIAAAISAGYAWRSRRRPASRSV